MIQTLHTSATALPSHALGASEYPRLLPLGDAALTVEFGSAIDPAIHARVTALDVALLASELPGILETVPTYRSLLICYEPGEIALGTLVAAVRELVAQGPGGTGAEVGRHWDIPAAYGMPYGDDLEEVARRCKLSPDEVVAAHCAQTFLVYLVGFAPGVPVMGRLPDRLHLPRRAVPRPSIPAGSVVIAAAQASIVSIPVPSGWHVLGRTPVRLFQPSRLGNPFLLRPGDTVQFYPIGAAEYDRLVAAAEAGEVVAAPGPVA